MLKSLESNILHNLDEHVRVIILSANGPVFSSGHDLKELVSLLRLQGRVGRGCKRGGADGGEGKGQKLTQMLGSFKLGARILMFQWFSSP